MSTTAHQPSAEENKVFKPLLLRLNKPDDKKAYDTLFADNKVLFVHDELYGQLQELIKSLNPSIRIKPADYAAYITEHLQGQDIAAYGVWAYYPWSRRMIHILDEEEFIEVRTNRNQYKITRLAIAPSNLFNCCSVALSSVNFVKVIAATKRSFT